MIEIKMSRLVIANALKEASCSYLIKKKYSAFNEIGLTSWGKLRADVLSLNLRGHIIMCEIKSSVSDYTTDSKWRNYLEFCNKLYFVFTDPVYQKLKDRLKVDLKGTGVGVLVLCPDTGYLVSKASARDRKMSGKTKRILVTRMAWRSGFSCANGNRKRQFLAEVIKDRELERDD